MKSETTPDLKPHLSFEMKHSLGALEIDAAFELTEPWTVLFGPSGSGKSTILRAIVGLLRPQHARIVQHRPDEVQVLTDTSNRIFVPHWRRFVRWSSQRPALFPHKTVRENLHFVAAAPRSERDAIVDAALGRFHLTHIADRKPALLSGGEQQRAAIARAAAASAGHLLLLDEPFTGLDAPLRDELLADLLLWSNQTKTPVLSVTHDLAEALQLRAEVIKLREGKMIAQGPAKVVLAEELRHLLSQLNGNS